MGRKLTFLMLVSGILLYFLSFVSSSRSPGNHHAEARAIPHRCDIDSSEECKNWRSLNPPNLQAEATSIFVRFFLHKNIYKPSESIELIYNNTNSVRNALNQAKPNSTWKILIPAFPTNGKSPFPNNVRDAYMQSMRENTTKHYNILIVDWNRNLLCNLDTYITDSGNLTYTGVAGKKVADMLIFLNDNKFLKLTENVHIIAFSIGAHVAGEAARFVFLKYAKHNLINRITALDPSGPDFWAGNDASPWNNMPRIRRSFVYFLDVYHTTKAYGLTRRLGDIDFFLNGEGDKSQPGCYRKSPSYFGYRYTQIDNFTELCSHVYSTEIFAKSINDKTMLGCTGCDDYNYFKNDRCISHECEDRPVFGESVDEHLYLGYPDASGLAFIDTDMFNSFGHEFEQQLVDAGEPKNGHLGWHQLC